MAGGIKYLEQSNVRFESDSDDYELYGSVVCQGEAAPKFCQPIKTIDTTPFQVIPCDFDKQDLILNGTFATLFDWNTGNGWIINTVSNRADHTGGGGKLTQTINALQIGIPNLQTFEIRFTVGAFNDNGGGGVLNVSIGGIFAFQINAATLPFPNQEFIIFKSITTPTDDKLEFDIGTNVDANISNVSMIVANCTLIQLVDFPSFPNNTSGWTFGGGWSATGQQAFILKNNVGVLEQTITLIQGAYYRIQYELVNVDLTSPGGSVCELKLGGNIVQTITTATATGIFIFNFFLFNNINSEIEFNCVNLGVVIDDCTVYELSAPAYIVEDCDGNFIEDHLLSDGDSSNDTSVIQFNQDWANFLEDCYQINVFDLAVQGSEEVTNGSFGGAGVPWSFGNNWSLVGNIATFFGAHTGFPILAQVLSLVADRYYKVDYDIIGWIDNSGGLDGSMSVNLGNISIIIYTTAAAAIGHHTHIVSTKGLIANSITFAIQPGTTNLIVTVDNVSITEVTIDACSECFQVDDWIDSNGCEMTKKLTSTNNENAFGYNFTIFTLILTMRVLARKKRPTYGQTVLDQEHTNTNTLSIVYAESRRVEELLFDLHPDYIYNMVQTMSDCDRWLIDNIVYTKEDAGIIPDWQPRFLAATASMNVFKASQPNRINDNI